MLKRILPGFYIATTLIGTIVGAGFASGQEVLKFFTDYGANGMLGIIVSTLLFIFLGYVLLMLGYQKGFSNYLEFLNHLFGKKATRIFDIIITLFFFCLTAVMASGAGSIINEHLHVPKVIGTALTVILGYFVVKYEVKGITRVNALIVPLLVVFIFVVALRVVHWDTVWTGFSGGELHKKGWFISSLLYVAYNLVLAVGVIMPLGKATKDVKDIIAGAVAGGLVLGALIFIIYGTLLSVPESFRAAEIPLLKAFQQFTVLKHYFFLVVLGEIFTTLIATSFSCLERIKVAVRQPVHFIFWSLVMVVGQIGFGSLISVLYPLFGAVCLLVILKLLLKVMKFTRW
ncbi:MAG: YkvI family membrane protein [Bacillota bacterium]